MPTHNLSLDAEAIALVLGAAGFSLFLKGELLSNMFISATIMSLFFLLGTHSRFSHPEYLNNHRGTVFMSILSGALMVPAASYLIYDFTGIEVFLALAVAGPATGSARIWSNMSGGDGELAGKISTITTVAALAALPVTLYTVNQSLVFRNGLLALFSFTVGYGLRKTLPEYGEEFREHFTRLSLWLIVVIGLAQLRLSYESGIFLPGVVSEAVFWFAALGAASTVISYGTASLIKYTPRKISNYYVSGFRNIEITLLASSMLGGEAILLTVVYYFFRQAQGFGSVAAFKKEDLQQYSIKSMVTQLKHKAT